MREIDLEELQEAALDGLNLKINRPLAERIAGHAMDIVDLFTSEARSLALVTPEEYRPDSGVSLVLIVDQRLMETRKFGTIPVINLSLAQVRKADGALDVQPFPLCSYGVNGVRFRPVKGRIEPRTILANERVICPIA